MVLVGLIVAATGSAFVYVKNQHLAQEDRKRQLEEEIDQLGRETAQLQLKIQVQLGPHNIVQSLLRNGHRKLDPIPAGALTTITSVPLPAGGVVLPMQESGHE